MKKNNEDEIKIIDLIDDISKNKNISKKNIARVIKGIANVIKNNLNKKNEIIFKNFLKLGFETVKDRITISRFDGKKYHRPAHLKFKTTFFSEMKKYLNEQTKK